MPFTRVLLFHAFQAVEHAKDQNWGDLWKAVPLSGDAGSPGWKDRVELWQQSIATWTPKGDEEGLLAAPSDGAGEESEGELEEEEDGRGEDGDPQVVV
jgi:hypothetical protein